MEFTVLESVDAVRDISDEWLVLLGQSSDPHPFVSPAWLLAWWAAFSRPEWTMQFGVLRQKGTLIAIAPLYVTVEKHWGRSARVLRFWENAYSNRISLLIANGLEQDAVKKLTACLYSSQMADWDIASLNSMVLADQAVQLLVSELGGRPMSCTVLESYSSPYRTLPGSAELLEQSLSPSFKKSLRRKTNKANRSQVCAEVTPDPRRLVDAVDISQETWQHEEKTGIASSSDVKRFFEQVVTDFAATGQLQFAFFSVDGVPVAFELNAIFARTIFNLKVGYRRKNSELSPGILLRHHVLCWAIEQEFEEFDFLGMNEPYKRHWASGTRVHGSVLFVRRRDFWWIRYFFRHVVKPYLRSMLPWAVGFKRWLQKRLRKFGSRRK